MKLLVISHTPHYRGPQGIVGWGPTIVELDHLSSLFDQIVHIAPLYREHPPASALPYQSKNILLHAVEPVGGDQFIDKIKILFAIPAYLRAILAEIQTADAVHVRCPANISLIAIVLLSLTRKPAPRWLKFAGNWMPSGRDALSYRFQRWWLKRGLARGTVTVNGDWPNQPGHVISFINPCMTERQHIEARRLAADKRLAAPVKLIFVGRLDSGKGADRVINICQLLNQTGIKFACDLIGDGELRQRLEQQACGFGLDEHIRFHGWLPRTALGQYYQGAHFILLPTAASEGWPKVLSEAMACGVVPLASTVSSIPQVLNRSGAGRAFAPQDVGGFANAVHNYIDHPEEWKAASQAGIEISLQYTYEAYLSRVSSMFESSWGLQLTSNSMLNGGAVE